MVELVVVIVIVGVLGAIAMPKFVGNRSFQERGYYEELATSLKFAQKFAVATGCAVRVQITAAGYSAHQQQATGGRCDTGDTTWPTAVMLADGQTLAGSTPSGVTVSPNVSLIFDTLGRSSLGADQTIAVGSLNMTVQAESGFVLAP